MNSVIQIKNLHVSYHGTPAIQGINLSIEAGHLVGIIGPNGAGKSTLLKAMLQLIPIDQGDIKISGGTVKQARRNIAYVPQRNQIDWDFPINVLDTVLIGTYPNLGLFKRAKKKQKEWAYACLEKVGMEDYSKRQIGELSGGQQQRVFLARALAQNTEILFLDEPFVGIDMSSEETIIKILKELRDQGKTIIVVHHDLSKAREYFNQLILLNKELIRFGDAEEVCQPEVMLKAYQSQFSFMNVIGGAVS